MSGTIPASDSYLVGVISDTHGRLPQRVSMVFKSVDLIIHAGDIGDPQIIDALERIAPTRVVRGNTDAGQWAFNLPLDDTIEVKGKRLYVIHDVYSPDSEAQSHRCDVIICGHTHRPLAQKRQGVLYLNPGSAVYSRFGYPPSVALLEFIGGDITARLVDLSKY